MARRESATGLKVPFPIPFIAAGILVPWLIVGCDAGSFTPPRPSELPGGSPAATTPRDGSATPVPEHERRRKGFGTTREDRRIDPLPCPDRRQGGPGASPPQGVRQGEGLAANDQAGGGENPQCQALVEEIQAAVSRRVDFLVLEPIDTPEVRAALHEAESRGVPVLLLDLPLPSRQSNKNIPTVSLAGFAECSKQLVAAALEDARHLGLPPDGTVVLVQNRLVDGYSKQRQESIRIALEGSGRVFRVLEFDGGRSEANAMLVDDLKANPKVCVILTEEDYGLGAAVDLHRARSEPGPPPFVLAGYASYDLRTESEVAVRLAGFVQRSLNDYAMKISQLARSALDGKSLPERATVEMDFVRMKAAQNSK